MHKFLIYSNGILKLYSNGVTLFAAYGHRDRKRKRSKMAPSLLGREKWNFESWIRIQMAVEAIADLIGSVTDGACSKSEAIAYFPWLE